MYSHPRSSFVSSGRETLGSTQVCARVALEVWRRIWLVLLLILQIGCISPKPPEKGRKANPVLIRQGTAEIRLKEYLFYFKMNYPEIIGNTDQELQSYIFDVFRKDLLIAQISQILGFRITGDQVESFINFKMTGKSIHLLPQDEQELWRREIQRRLAIQQFLEREVLSAISVEDEEIHLYYQAHQGRFKRETMYNIRFMQASSEKRAKDFIAELKRSKGSFKEIAGSYSENEGYQLSTPLGLNDLMTPFQEQIRKTNPGQYSRIIPVKHGETTYYYVLYLESEIPAAQIPYEEAYDHIRAELEKERSQTLLEQKLRQFRGRIPTKVYWENLPFAYREASQRKEV